MTTTFMAFHSLKGGTGKTTIASNVAALKAMRGQNVILLDYDFRAPSLHVFFKVRPKHWLNDFLNEKCSLDEVLVETPIRGKGKLTVGLADPSTEAMREMMTRGREWEANALRRILAARADIQKAGYNLVIFDTSPGIQFSSFNALAASNLVILVMNRDELYREEIVDLVSKVYRPFGRKIGIVLNKVLVCDQSKLSMEPSELGRRSAELVKDVESKFQCPVFALIPCYCDVLIGGYEVYAYEKPDHPFAKEISTVGENIEKNLN